MTTCAIAERSADTARTLVRRQVVVRGAVQGVGFRPFVYRLAREHNLRGWVQNDPGGVVIDVEGSEEILETFVKRLTREKRQLLLASLQIREKPIPTRRCGTSGMAL